MGGWVRPFEKLHVRCFGVCSGVTGTQCFTFTPLNIGSLWPNNSINFPPEGFFRYPWVHSFTKDVVFPLVWTNYVLIVLSVLSTNYLSNPLYLSDWHTCTVIHKQLTMCFHRPEPTVTGRPWGHRQYGWSHNLLTSMQEIDSLCN